MLMRMKSLNLYRADGDREVWERAESDAKAAGVSLSAHVVAVLRAQQRIADAQEGEMIAPFVEVVGAHVATDAVEYPNATVRVDAAGNLVSVDFTERAFVE